MITYDYLTEYMLFDSDVCSMLQKLTQSSFFFVLQFGTASLSAARRDERKDILEMVCSQLKLPTSLPETGKVRFLIIIHFI
jgi:hypothetical protein